MYFHPKFQDIKEEVTVNGKCLLEYQSDNFSCVEKLGLLSQIEAVLSNCNTGLKTAKRIFLVALEFLENVRKHGTFADREADIYFSLLSYDGGYWLIAENLAPPATEREFRQALQVLTRLNSIDIVKKKEIWKEVITFPPAISYSLPLGICSISRYLNSPIYYNIEILDETQLQWTMLVMVS